MNLLKLKVSMYQKNEEKTEENMDTGNTKRYEL